MNSRFVFLLTIIFSISTVGTALQSRTALGDMIIGSGVFDQTDIVDGESVFSTITITDAGLIQDISITIEGIEHTAAGDLVAELRFLGEGGSSGPGGEPAYLFFRPNVDGTGLPGSLANLDGNYTYTTNQEDEDFWSETAIPDDQTVDDSMPFFASDTNGSYHNLAGPDFFQGFNTAGQWQLVISDENSVGNNAGSVQGWTIQFHATVIPEPDILLILLIGSSGILLRRR